LSSGWRYFPRFSERAAPPCGELKKFAWLIWCSTQENGAGGPTSGFSRATEAWGGIKEPQVKNLWEGNRLLVTR